MNVSFIYLPLNIHWTRHAESCANYHTNTIDDKPPKNYKDKNNIGREKINNNINNNIIGGGNIITTLKGFCSYHPPLSYIGIQQAIKLSEKIDTSNINYDIVLCSPLLRTIMTTMIAFRNKPNTKIQIVPFINEELNLCNGFDYQNNIPNLDILKRMVNYCTKWISSEEFKYYDDILLNDKLQEIALKKEDIYISSGLSKYATGILKYSLNTTKQDNSSLQPLKNKYDYINAIKILIGTILNNKQNNTETLFTKNTFDVLKDIDLKDIDLKGGDNLKEIKELMEYYTFFDNYTTKIKLPDVDYTYIQSIKQQNDKFITGWKINNIVYDINPNLDNFIDIILPKIIQDHKLNNQSNSDSNPINIFIASHGTILKSYLNLQNRPKNTEMYEMKCIMEQSNNQNKIYRSTNSTITNYYIPESIRQTYKNFEILNPDICTNNSIKGVINSKEIKGVNLITDKITIGLTKYPLNDDLNDKYKKKYFKYKSKYNNLKNN